MLPAKKIRKPLGGSGQRHAAHDYDDDENEQKRHQDFGNFFNASADFISNHPAGQEQEKRLKAH